MSAEATHAPPLDLLVVEDNPGDARLVRELLAEAAGSRWQVRVADRLSRALEALAQRPPDAVLLDLGLPDSEGPATADRLLAEAPDVPVVVLTGFAHEAIARAAMGKGIQDYLVKGEVDGPTLERSLRYAIERERMASQLRQQAADLQATRARLDHIVSSSPTITYVLQGGGPRLRTSWVSANLSRLLGYPREAPLEPGWWSRNVHPDDLDRLLDDEARLLREGRASNEYRFRHANGDWRVVHDEQVVIPESDGRPLEVIGSWMDVTDRRALEAQFLQAQKMESIGRLAGGVAHDFNNILGVVTGYTQLLSARLPDEPRLRRYTEAILDAAMRAADLTRQLLAFSRQQVVRLERLNLNEVIGESRKMLQRILGEDIELLTRLADDAGGVVADRTQIGQILLNLTVNARDAMPDGGTLVISTARAGDPSSEARDFVELAVADTGHGMTPEVRARIFEPFFTTKEAGKGTGLGLGTVYGIVEQAGGRISAESEVGQGSTFRVLLPRAVADDEPAATPPEVGELPRGSEALLVVEDEQALRSVVTEVLTDLGYRVLSAGNGAEALQVADHEGGRLDLVVTDVVMPGIGGPELVKRLRTAHPGLAALYVSGHTDDDVLRRGVRHHEVEFLQKPFTAEGLARRVRAALDARKAGGGTT